MDFYVHHQICRISQSTMTPSCIMLTMSTRGCHDNDRKIFKLTMNMKYAPREKGLESELRSNGLARGSSSESRPRWDWSTETSVKTWRQVAVAESTQSGHEVGCTLSRRSIVTPQRLPEINDPVGRIGGRWEVIDVSKSKHEFIWRSFHTISTNIHNRLWNDSEHEQRYQDIKWKH